MTKFKTSLAITSTEEKSLERLVKQIYKSWKSNQVFMLLNQAWVVSKIRITKQKCRYQNQSWKAKLVFEQIALPKQIEIILICNKSKHESKLSLDITNSGINLDTENLNVTLDQRFLQVTNKLGYLLLESIYLQLSPFTTCNLFSTKTRNSLKKEEVNLEQIKWTCSIPINKYSKPSTSCVFNIEDTKRYKYSMALSISIYAQSIAALVRLARRKLKKLKTFHDKNWYSSFMRNEPKATIWWFERSIFILSHFVAYGKIKRKSFDYWLIPYIFANQVNKKLSI